MSSPDAYVAKLLRDSDKHITPDCPNMPDRKPYKESAVSRVGSTLGQLVGAIFCLALIAVVVVPFIAAPMWGKVVIFIVVWLVSALIFRKR